MFVTNAPTRPRKWMLLRGLIDLGFGRRTYLPNDTPHYDAIDIAKVPPNPEWKKIGERLNERNLASLIRGCVLAEEASAAYLQECRRQAEFESILQRDEMEIKRQEAIWLQNQRRRLERRKLRKQADKPRNHDGNSESESVGKLPPHWWGERGSTTYVRHLHPVYAERFGNEKAWELVLWCRQHSTNRYLPF